MDKRYLYGNERRTYHIFSSPSKAPHQCRLSLTKKKELAADIIAFFSIISAYLFISITLHINIFECYLGIELDNYSLIAFIYLSYATFISLLKVISILPLVFPKVGKKRVEEVINKQINDSLLNVLVISALYIFIHGSVAEMTLEQFCHIAVWLWIGETARIFGSFLGQVTGIDSFSYWGWSIIWILFFGGLLEGVNAGIFVLL